MATSTFRNDNLAANSKSANILAGNINEFTQRVAAVKVYTIASASGVRMTILADKDVVMDDQEIPAIGTSLVVPDNIIAQFAVGGGTRLAIFLRETAGVATTDVLTRVDVDYM